MLIITGKLESSAPVPAQAHPSEAPAPPPSLHPPRRPEHSAAVARVPIDLESLPPAELPVVRTSFRVPKNATELPPARAEAIVPAELLEELSRYQWRLTYHGRGHIQVIRTVAHRVYAFLNRDIFERYFGQVPAGSEFIFKDGNRLNCHPSNLDVARPRRSRTFSLVRRDSITGYVGVTHLRDRGRYQARIVPGRQFINLGVYPNPELAAYAYNHAHALLFPDSGPPNFLPPDGLFADPSLLANICLRIEFALMQQGLLNAPE